MTTTKYSNTSPYYETGQTSWYLGVMTPRNIPALDSDQLITIKGAYVMRPDILSYQLYQTTRLWWVFSMRNPNIIKDPIYDFVEGIQIYITDRDALLGILNA